MERQYRIVEMMGKSTPVMRGIRDVCATESQTMSREDMLYLRQTMPMPWGTMIKSLIGPGAKGQEWTRPWQSRWGSADRTVEMKHMTINRIP